MELDKKFDHLKVQKNRYASWCKNEVFKADITSNKPPFSIIIPPPNVTGKLHLGHAWDTTLQDVLIRYKKMMGYETVFIPGMDHAGIATQAKVDEKLRNMGISSFEIGREKFLEYAWSWKNDYADQIREQWEQLGLALDYSKEKFTLDKDVNQAVNKVFVDLYNKGYIYRGYRITNWDPKAQTALSDIEVIHKEVKGQFYHLKYYLADQSGFVEVATTRPETCFGDVALIINPEDPRVEKLLNQQVYIPGTNKLIPILVDRHADMNFGTGVVKITPAHDPNDYQVGKRLNLEMPIVMNLNGTMNEYAFEFENMDRFDCRIAYIKKLEDLDLVVKIVEHIHNVGHSERTGVIVEPLLSKQWYVKMDKLAQKSLEFQKTTDKIIFTPFRFEETFSTWMENVCDWCISRQLWWGHQIPAWYHKTTGEILVSETPPEDDNYIQDEDVLDTWFSSALWPLITTKWSKTNPEMSKFFPTNVLVTGYDIIFFWVSRMIFQSLEFSDQKPFSDVLIHGLIRAEDGRKMSKSLGNGIDPIDVINSHGADALRFFLTTNSSPGLDLRYSEEKLDATWNFINKIWNVSRYVLLNTVEVVELELREYFEYLDSADEYILYELNNVITHVNIMMDKFEFGEVARSLYNFIYEDFSSWYVEISKVSLTSSNVDIVSKTKLVLRTVNIAIIKMLHPFMPFVTDEIYTQIENVDSIMLTSWPRTIEYEFLNKKIDNFKKIKEIITEIRNIRQENEIKPSLLLTIYIETTIEFDVIELDILSKIAKLEDIKINEPIKEDVISSVIDLVTIHIATNGTVNKKVKIDKLNAFLNKVQEEIIRSLKILSNEKFMIKAPKEKKNEEISKAIGYINQYEETIILLKELMEMPIYNKKYLELKELIKELNEK